MLKYFINMRGNKIILGAVVSFMMLCTFSLEVSAGGTEKFESITVNAYINRDSTVEFEETYVHRYTGEFHAVVLKIPLHDYDAAYKCEQDPSLTCGGFERLEILSFIDRNGNELSLLDSSEYRYDNAGHILSPPDTYTTQMVNDGSIKSIQIQWVYAEGGEFFNDETLEYSIRYKVYGSIGYEENYDLFYWDTVAKNRTQTIDDLSVNIYFPEDIGFEEEDMTVTSEREYTFYYDYIGAESVLKLTAELLQPDQNQTLMVKMDKGILDKHATLLLDLDPEGQFVTFDNFKEILVYDEITGLTSGYHKFIFYKDGYKPETIEINLKPGEERLVEISLELTPWQAVVQALIIFGNICGCLLFPALIIWLYRFFQKHAKDKNRNKVVVPEYKIPTGIHPYLLGSIKDETVDIVDITATIIDVAYRGYIKIKEFDAKSVLGIKIKAKDYELIKVKEFTSLSTTEKKIMTSFFGSKDRVTTTSLKNSFYTKLPGINKKIYKEMVDKEYFKESPEKVRNKYYGIGTAITVFGFLSISVNTVFPAFMTSSASIIIFGIVMLFTAKHMPAKTTKGSAVFDKILGFKMYLETAEKHRVQNLTPETFEKFLAYAIVFGIEKKWAEKFKSIYTTPPDWYEGSNMANWNSIYLANALSSFRNNTSSIMTSKPSSSSSYSGGSSFGGGGGWSGGGGFSGGFSGGGGGGTSVSSW